MLVNIPNLDLPTLFCKPAFKPFCNKPVDENVTSILFSKYYSSIKATISFRSLGLVTDLPLIHEWVHRTYAHEYWQMNGHYSQLYAMYQCMELNPFCHSFVGVLTPGPFPTSPGGGGDMTPWGNIICQFDVYSVMADELRNHVEAEAHDCGFHLLMAPNDKPLPGLTVCIINAFLEHYFSFADGQRMYAEPDMNNHKSISLLERCGFQRIKTVEMSYKTAHVYCREKGTEVALGHSQ